MVEMVVDEGMDRTEFLKGVHLSKSQHGPLASSERLMGILRPVVQPAACLLDISIANFLHGGAIGP